MIADDRDRRIACVSGSVFVTTPSSLDGQDVSLWLHVEEMYLADLLEFVMALPIKCLLEHCDTVPQWQTFVAKILAKLCFPSFLNAPQTSKSNEDFMGEPKLVASRRRSWHS